MFTTGLTPETTRPAVMASHVQYKGRKSIWKAISEKSHMMMGGGLFGLLLVAGLIYLIMRSGWGAHMVHGGHGGHAGHRGNMSHGDGAVSRIDPVCGMAVAANEGYSEVQNGREYRFCSRSCLDKFDADPARYL